MAQARAERSTSGIARFFWRYLRPNISWVLLLVCCYFLVSLLTAAQPLVMAPMLDIVLGDQVVDAGTPLPDGFAELNLNNIGPYFLSVLNGLQLSEWETIWAMAMAYLVISILLYLLNFGVYLLALQIRIHSEREIQKDLFGHVISLSLDFFNRKRTGELLSRLEQDTRASVASLAEIARSSVVSSLLALFYGSLLVRTNFRLTIFIVVAGALHYVLTQLIRNPIKQRVRDQFNIMAQTTAYIQEVLSNIRVVKSFAAEAYERLRLSGLVERLRVINLRFGVFKHVDEPIGQIINAASNVAILLLATNELFQGTLTTTGFVLYLYIGRAILDPITDLARTYTVLQTTLATSERVYELFGEKTSIANGNLNIVELREGIELCQVAFAYGENAVLRDVNIHIRKGQVTALVGPSGAGKSTLFDLLLRFYDPRSGAIVVDGENLTQFDLDQYRRLFGVVSQESLLFNASVFDNIAYPGLDVNGDQVKEAAQVANAHEFIERMPQGYDSLIGDRGVLVSGGQRQRLAIARAVVRKPQILLLDEATSSLDSESEKLVQDAIDRAIRGTTAVVIAHRLSTVVHADQIVVLDQGQVVDQGKHAELLARCDLYRTLCELQFDLTLSSED